MNEYEYINRKEEIIKEEGLNKKELGELEKQGLANRQVNVSPESIKTLFDIDNPNNVIQYSTKEVDKINEFIGSLTSELVQ